MLVVAPHTTALRYEIRVLGRLDQHWADWFDGFEIVSCGDHKTAMVGCVADQAALHGLLNKIRDLGLTLLAVTALELESTECIGGAASASSPVLHSMPADCPRDPTAVPAAESPAKNGTPR